MLRQLDLWYHTPLGSSVFAAERQELNKYLPHYFGQHLLQIGGPSELWLFEQSPIQHRVRLSPEYMPVFRGPSVQGTLNALPFLPESFEVILLPHVLEFITQPTALLQQAYSLLTPEGRLILLGFNPCSIWGVVKWFKQQRTLPWRGEFRSVWAITKLMKKQGFTIEKTLTAFYRPPVRRKSWLRRLLFLEAMGRLLWADCGAVYMVIATKNVVSLLPADKRLKLRPVNVGT